jgi:hypothetical protein
MAKDLATQWEYKSYVFQLDALDRAEKRMVQFKDSKAYEMSGFKARDSATISEFYNKYPKLKKGVE